MHIRKTIPLAIAALAVGTLSGCGDSSDGPGDGGRLSIASIMGQDTNYSPEHWQDQEKQVQDLVARCMTEKGWEYIPVQYPDMYYEYSEEDEFERRQREGFGISYWILNQGSDEAFMGPVQDWVDPNQAIVESFTDAERTAYYESLHGTEAENNALMTTEIDPVTGEEYQVMMGYGAGCYGEASGEIYGQDQYQSQDYWESLSRFYEELWERIEADPRIKALDGEWSSCMKAGGLDYSSPNDFWEKAYADLQGRFDAIVGPDFHADPFMGWTDDEINAFFENSTEEEISALFNTSRDVTEEQRVALEALLADEIVLSVAEYSCSKPYNEKYQTISQEIEERYAIEHRAELEALALSLGIGT